ncbi:hypothetical protein Ahy_A08g039590 [Arachis hypogaea]|uniref:UBC core domain-containing protein n=1 Tax=Arachis hypogaea TaxID=3818 RepID=A0A445BWR1_ARAHY|nr:hypothetical protein Ahy_A08g039590 [Arachis hypogaea]
MVELNNDPPPHCSATIIGPPETAYQSGIFFLDIIFLSDYPLNPPQDGWSPALTITKVLTAIRSLVSSSALLNLTMWNGFT